MTCAVIFFWQ